MTTVDPKEVTRFYERAEVAVKLAIGPLAHEIMDNDLPEPLFYSVSFGALTGICSFVRAVIPGKPRPQMEAYILGVVRGVLRDAGMAIDADGNRITMDDFFPKAWPHDE